MQAPINFNWSLYNFQVSSQS